MEVAREVLGEKFPKLPFSPNRLYWSGGCRKGRWSVVGHSHRRTSHRGRSEKELIAAFVAKIAVLKPRLVTFNGASFDLPVVRYRAMLHRISAPGLEGRPYSKRYTDDATDLCDVLSSFDSRSKMKLNDLCRALNLPGKPDGVDGSQVEQLFAEGRIADIADYCECDVVGTYRLWLLHELFRGTLSAEQHERSELALSDFIVARIQDKPHWARLRAGAVEAVVKMTVVG